MTTATSFFEPWEPEPIDSFRSFLDLVGSTFSKWSDRNFKYAWRGVINSDWPLHSALYRRLVATHPSRTEEIHLSQMEGHILTRAHRWGLHYLERSHLPILYELAMLQHFGAPTRLLDVTFNPLVALYFAVEDQRDNYGKKIHEDKDGRLFIFDVSDRLINERDRENRIWEEAYARPWSFLEDKQRSKVPNWTTKYWAWRPAPIEARFAAQSGGFLFGGVPQTGGGRWRRGPEAGSTSLRIDDVRACTSIAVRFNKLEANAGRPADNPSFTVRVLAEAKAEIRTSLRDWFDIDARSIYPDYPGFALAGLPELNRV